MVQKAIIILLIIIYFSGSLAGYVASIGTSSIIDHSGRAVAKPFKACKLASCADKVESIATEFTFLTTAGTYYINLNYVLVVLELQLMHD